MRTSRPFSTISYNTPDFLKFKLNELVDTRKIQFYAFIYHLAEKDEKKDHIHLYIEPNGLMQTDMLLDYLLEVDPSHPLKPLKIMPIRNSKFSDWYYYGIHDRDYLATKMLVRAFHYKKSDIVASDTDYLNELIAMSTPVNLKQKQIVDLMRLGYTATDLATKGIIPINQLTSYTTLSNSILYGSQDNAQDLDKELEARAIPDKALPF